MSKKNVKVASGQRDNLNRTYLKKRKTLSLTLGLPVSVNHMYVNTKFGKTLNKRAKDYVRVITASMLQQLENANWKLLPKDTWYYADLVFYFPDKRIRDNHNLLKLLFDVMQPYVFKNDYYVMPRVISCELDREKPRVEVLIQTIQQGELDKNVRDFENKFI